MEWLREQFVVCSTPQEDELVQFVQDCHSLRGTLFFEPLKLFTGHGQTYSHKFEQLYKLLCKLGKHITVTRKLFEAAVHLSSDFAKGFTIRTVPSSKLQSLPLTPKEATVESTIGRMFPDSEAQDKFRQRLQSVLNTNDVLEVLQGTRSTKTRVHAELLLIDYFDHHGCSFLNGNDKYIGCSKPACYLCHAYISNHPESYAVPASHQKLYVGWRVPDVDSETTNYERRLKFQEEILLKLINKLRHDLQTEIESDVPRRAFHADSTAGVTSDFASRIAAWFDGMSVSGTVRSSKYCMQSQRALAWMADLYLSRKDRWAYSRTRQ